MKFFLSVVLLTGSIGTFAQEAHLRVSGPEQEPEPGVKISKSGKGIQFESGSCFYCDGGTFEWTVGFGCNHPAKWVQMPCHKMLSGY